MDCAVAAIKDI
jgi:hypothetical protein